MFPTPPNKCVHLNGIISNGTASQELFKLGLFISFKLKLTTKRNLFSYLKPSIFLFNGFYNNVPAKGPHNSFRNMHCDGNKNPIEKEGQDTGPSLRTKRKSVEGNLDLRKVPEHLPNLFEEMIPVEGRIKFFTLDISPRKPGKKPKPRPPVIKNY